MLASYNNFLDSVRALLRHCDVNCVSEYGDSSLHYSVARGCQDTVVTLLEAGAAVNLPNCHNATPLWNGVTNYSILKTLIGAGAAIDIASTGYALDHNECFVYETPKLPVEVSLLEGYFDCTKLLLTAGCTVPAGMTRMLTKAQKRFSIEQSLAGDIFRLVCTPRRLSVTARCRVREVVGRSSALSTQQIKAGLQALPGLSPDCRQQLLSFEYS